MQMLFSYLYLHSSFQATSLASGTFQTSVNPLYMRHKCYISIISVQILTVKIRRQISEHCELDAELSGTCWRYVGKNSASILNSCTFREYFMKNEIFVAVVANCQKSHSGPRHVVERTRTGKKDAELVGDAGWLAYSLTFVHQNSSVYIRLYTC